MLPAPRCAPDSTSSMRFACASVSPTCRCRAGGFGRLTVSIGVATWDADGRSVDGLLDVADERLYQAKAAGRNRIVGPEAAGMLGAGER